MVSQPAQRHFRPLTPDQIADLGGRGIGKPKGHMATMVGLYLDGQRTTVTERLGGKLDTKSGLTFEEGALLLCAAGIDADSVWHKRLQADNPGLYGKAMAKAREWHGFFSGQSVRKSGMTSRLGFASTAGVVGQGLRDGHFRRGR